jgi:uncharacterized membrane protein YgcG
VKNRFQNVPLKFNLRRYKEGYKTAPVVAQRYLTKPFLIDGFKFDLRIYALVLSCDPLRIHVFNDGLARFCTEKYEPPKANNLKDVCMHLTNYAVNKHNENFVFNEDAGASDEGSKWSIQGLKEWMETNGHDFCAMWADCVDLIVKTVISIQPVLAHNYHSVLPPENDGYSCFEILGLDVMMDTELRPWLIEVNHSPSFTVDTPLDMAIKEDLISDTIELVRIDPKAIKRAQAEEKAEAQSRLFGGGAGAGSAGAGAGESGGGGGGGGKSGGGGGGGGGSGRMTREEIEVRRAAALASREKWEEKHSGSYEIAYPSPDPTKQALYERLLEGAREAFNTHGSHSRVRDTLERAKAQAQRKASEEEAKAEAAKNGLKAPAGAKLRRAVDAAMAGKSAANNNNGGGAGGRPGVSSSNGLGRVPMGRRGSMGGGGSGGEQLGEQSADGGDSRDEGQFRLYYPSELLGLPTGGRGGPGGGGGGGGGSSQHFSVGSHRSVTAFTAAAIARSAAAAAAAAAADGSVPAGSPKGGATKYGRRANTVTVGEGVGGAASDPAAAYLEAAAAYHRRYMEGGEPAANRHAAAAASPSPDMTHAALARRNSSGGGNGGVSPHYATLEAMIARMGIADEASSSYGHAALRRGATSPVLGGGFVGGSSSRPGSGRVAAPHHPSRRLTTREVNPQPSSIASMAAAHAAQYAYGGAGGHGGVGSENRHPGGAYAYASSITGVAARSSRGENAAAAGAAEYHQQYGIDDIGAAAAYAAANYGYGAGYGLAHQPQHQPQHQPPQHQQQPQHQQSQQQQRVAAAAASAAAAQSGGGVVMGVTGGIGAGDNALGKGGPDSMSFCRSISLSARRRGHLAVTGTGQFPGVKGGGGGGGGGGGADPRRGDPRR